MFTSDVKISVFTSDVKISVFTSDVKISMFTSDVDCSIVDMVNGLSQCLSVVILLKFICTDSVCLFLH